MSDKAYVIIASTYDEEFPVVASLDKDKAIAALLARKDDGRLTEEPQSEYAPDNMLQVWTDLTWTYELWEMPLE